MAGVLRRSDSALETLWGSLSVQLLHEPPVPLCISTVFPACLLSCPGNNLRERTLPTFSPCSLVLVPCPPGVRCGSVTAQGSYQWALHASLPEEEAVTSHCLLEKEEAVLPPICLPHAGSMLLHVLRRGPLSNLQPGRSGWGAPTSHLHMKFTGRFKAIGRYFTD